MRNVRNFRVEDKKKPGFVKKAIIVTLIAAALAGAARFVYPPAKQFMERRAIERAERNTSEIKAQVELFKKFYANLKEQPLFKNKNPAYADFVEAQSFYDNYLYPRISEIYNLVYKGGFSGAQAKELLDHIGLLLNKVSSLNKEYDLHDRRDGRTLEVRSFEVKHSLKKLNDMISVLRVIK